MIYLRAIQYCEAQAKGKVKDRLGKVTTRSQKVIKRYQNLKLCLKLTVNFVGTFHHHHH